MAGRRCRDDDYPWGLRDFMVGSPIACLVCLVLHFQPLDLFPVLACGRAVMFVSWERCLVCLYAGMLPMIETTRVSESHRPQRVGHPLPGGECTAVHNRRSRVQ